MADLDNDRQLELAMHRLLHLGGVTASSNFAVVAGRRIHFLDTGTGPPLVLLHGAGGGAANWYRLLAELGRTHRVLAPDLPGFGFSDPIEPASPISLHVATLLAEWLRALGVRRADVVGTSFGGLIAIRLSELLDTPRIIVADTVGISGMGWPLRMATKPALARLVVTPTRRGTRAMLRHALTSRRLPRTHEDALTDYLYASARRTDAKLMARAFCRFGAERETLDPGALRKLSPRLRVIWGARDRLMRLQDIQRAVALAGCDAVRIIPGAGHSPNWEDPDRLLAEITEFLQTNGFANDE